MRLLALLPLVILSACAGYGPNGLAPGAGEAQVVQRMGEPTARFPRPEGGTWLEFQRGPAGLDTFMLDLDPGGRLLRSEQVLDHAHFSSLVPGMGREQVLYAIGHPGMVQLIGWQQRELWFYRYRAPVCQLFQVVMTLDGQAAEVGYGRDPTCDPDRD